MQAKLPKITPAVKRIVQSITEMTRKTHTERFTIHSVLRYINLHVITRNLTRHLSKDAHWLAFTHHRGLF